MSFVLNSIINIGNYQFYGVHEVVIKKSIHSFTDTCNIKIPVTCRVRTKDKVLQTESIQFVKSSEQFVEGDKVKVQLGYNKQYQQEFVGFVRRINFTTPLEIECEGYSYQLRNNLTAKKFKNVDYREILKYIIAGTDIVFHPAMKAVQSIPVNDFLIGNLTGIQALEEFRKHMRDSLVMFFVDNQLYAGLDLLYAGSQPDYIGQTNTTKYLIDWNTIKSNDLKLVDPGNLKVTVQIGNGKKDGSKQMVSGGDKSSTFIIKEKVTILSDAATLKMMADIKAGKKKYKGFEGKVTAFGQPFCQHAYRIILTHKHYHEMEGTYLADSIEVKYDRSGFRRIVGIGHNLSL